MTKARVLIGLLFVAALTAGSNAATAARVASVRATILASMSGWQLGFAAARGDASKVLIQNKAPDSAVWAVYRSPIQDGPIYPQSVAYYVRAVDALYARYRIARKYEVPDIVDACLPVNASARDCRRITRGY
jgi:hypothetical protein